MVTDGCWQILKPWHFESAGNRKPCGLIIIHKSDVHVYVLAGVGGLSVMHRRDGILAWQLGVLGLVSNLLESGRKSVKRTLIRSISNNQPSLMRLALTMRQKSRLSVKPSSTLYTVVSSQVRKIFRGFGILELGQMSGGSKIGLDLVDISVRRSAGCPIVYSLANTNLVLRLVFVNVLLLPNTPIVTVDAC